jgi:putative ATP-dependent endonuclease of the OLD family
MDWNISSRFSSLVGPGDSTKSTILAAIEFALSASNNVVFNDTDFYLGVVEDPIEITVTVGRLPQDLLRDNKFGLEARGWNTESGLHDEPQNGDELVLSVRLFVDDSLDPKWIVVNDRKPDGEPIGPYDRSAMGLIRISADVEQHLSWGRGSALLRLGNTQTNLRQIIAEANRRAREIVAGADLEALKNTVVKTEQAAVDLGVKPFEHYTPGLETRAIPGRTASLTIYDGVIPVKQSGLGSQRLIALAAQSLAFPEGAIVLIDEVEVGLEPHRICHLLRKLKAATEQPAGLEQAVGQVLLTTHSPIVILELPAENHYVVRSISGRTEVRAVTTELQATLRRAPEALLGRKVIVCEGKTELGICRALEPYWVQEQGVPLTHIGTVLLEGRGSDNPKTAIQLASLGYSVALLADSDVALNPNVEALEAAGVKVIQWSGNASTEERVALDLPLDKLSEVLDLAVRWISEDSVLDTVCHRLGKNRRTIGNSVDAWLRNGLSEGMIRVSIGQAAKEKEWFKRIDIAEELGKMIARALPGIHSSDLSQKLKQVAAWAYEQ